MKIKLLLLGLLISFFSFGQVPDTETFDLDTVVSVVNPTTPDLIDCFNDTIPGYMNRTYYADYFAEYMNKLNLLMFRDYGPHNVGPGEDTTYCVDYGLLYNWYAATDVRNITSSDDWGVPTITQWDTLRLYLDPAGYTHTNISGGFLKDTGLVYWNTPNTDASNSVSFNGRGAGYRVDVSGAFESLKSNCWMFASTTPGGNYANSALLYNNSASLVTNQLPDKKYGATVRLMRSSTTLSHGETGTYVGNDGKVYRTICIGTQEWLADNLVETKFRTGDIIPWHGEDNDSVFTNLEWAALTTAGVCAYNNDKTLVTCDDAFSFPAY